MGLLDLFDSRDKKKRLSHIRNLIAVACADGSLDKVEMDLIMRIGIRAGLGPDELQRIFARPESISFYPPDSYQERIEQLYDMVMVMMVDGEIDENEMLLCKTTAIKLGFKAGIINAMVNQIIESVAEGLAIDLVLRKLMELVEE